MLPEARLIAVERENEALKKQIEQCRALYNITTIYFKNRDPGPMPPHHVSERLREALKDVDKVFKK